jgi:hypothetical protein
MVNDGDPTEEKKAGASRGAAEEKAAKWDPLEASRRFLVRRFGRWGTAVVVVLSVGSYALAYRATVLDLWHRTFPPAIPKADRTKFAVLIADLVDDDDHRHKRLIREALSERSGVQALSIDRVIALTANPTDAEIRTAHNRARIWLADSGADVAIWGVVLRNGNEALPKIYWTVATQVTQPKVWGRYPLTENLDLPPLFWSDLVSTLNSLVTSSVAGSSSGVTGGQWATGEEEWVRKIRSLRNDPGPTVATPEGAADLAIVAAQILNERGEHRMDSALLEESRDTINWALSRVSVETLPIKWARLQFFLGSSLSGLAQRRPDEAGHLAIRSAAAHREALRILLEHHAEEADVQGSRFNICWASAMAGRMTKEPALLDTAVTECRAALTGADRGQPISMAIAHGGYCGALGELASFRHDRNMNHEAINACRMSLSEARQANATFFALVAEANLGSMLHQYGDLFDDPTPICEGFQHHLRAWNQFDNRSPFWSDLTAKRLDGDVRHLRQCVRPDQMVACSGNQIDVLERFTRSRSDDKSQPREPSPGHN